MTKREHRIQEAVRRRDRFLCQMCGNKGEQYAHIKADADGGEYTIGNLIFLCWSCHNQLETARSSKEMKEALSELQRRLRDAPKRDSVLSSIFAFVPGKKLVVHVGGGFKFVDVTNILERLDKPDEPYVQVSLNDKGLIDLNVQLTDSKGETYLRLINSKLTINTASAWDIVIRRRHLSILHKDKDVSFRLRQRKNLDLEISGVFFLNGEYYKITKRGIFGRDSGSSFSRNSKVFKGDGLGEGQGLLLGKGLAAF